MALAHIGVGVVYPKTLRSLDDFSKLKETLREEALQLVLSDMVMPKMVGTELAGRLKSIRPDIRVAFMSGYSEFSRGDLGRPFPHVPILQKPFSPVSLVGIVRQALTQPQAQQEQYLKECHLS